MPSTMAKDAITFLQREIAAEIDRSEQGAIAYRQANLSGPSHIGAIIVSQSEVSPDNEIRFSAFVELYDDNDHQYEAQIDGVCQKLVGDSAGWKKKSITVIEAGPLPKGG